MDGTQRNGCEMKKFILRLHLFLIFFIPSCLSAWLLYFYMRVLRCPSHPYSGCVMPETIENSAPSLIIAAGSGLIILIGINYYYSRSPLPLPIATQLEGNSASAAVVVGIIGGLGMISSTPNPGEPGFIELGCKIPVIVNYLDFCEEQLTVILCTVHLAVLGLKLGIADS